MKKRLYRFVAVFTALNLLYQAFFPSIAFALTGGPSQPEVQGFEPVSTSEMVDLFSGDFQYNIPLLDVDGYPVNISYHSGISMDQEASWVGLGWNVNPGVINRNLRGIPDDFNGDVVKKKFNMRPNKTYTFNPGFDIELCGDQTAIGLSLNYTLGLKYNNYNGVGVENSVNVNFSSSKGAALALTSSLGVSSSNEDGLTIQPSVGLSLKMAGTTKGSTTLSSRIGSTFNSRAGLKELSIKTSLTSNVRYKNGENKSDHTTLISAAAKWDFGSPTFTPELTLPFINNSFAGSFTFGAAFFTAHPDLIVGGSYSCQSLATNSTSAKAYGYMNSDKAMSDSYAMMDFNREKDGVFTMNTPDLPVTNNTFDLFSVSGQGIGGSYRVVRSDYGYVYDPGVSNSGISASIGAELGFGEAFHLGLDVTGVLVNSNSERWALIDNDAVKNLQYQSTTGDPLYEKYYFKEANEKTVNTDPTFFKKMGGLNSPDYLVINNAPDKYPSLTSVLSDESGNQVNLDPKNYRTKREIRNQNISVLTRGELAKAGLENLSTLYPSASSDHIGEITALDPEGKRYVYGIAAYNTTEEDVTFSVGENLYSGDGGIAPTDCQSQGMITYADGDDSESNGYGVENYYSNTTLPAYAHSFLLTAVLSPDYIDNDNIRGPSDGDYGNYTKLSYNKLSNNYKWRTPFGDHKANFNEGVRSDPYDDKASFIYGEKEIWYLDQIETKNYVAKFITESRGDGLGVTGKTGVMDASNPLKLLRKISLFSKKDLTIPVKEVHFIYSYELCPEVPNFSLTGVTPGKLTLKEIYFTYGNTKKGRFSPYIFNYEGANPDYNIKGYDRWGNYKPNDCVNWPNTGLPNSDFPYVEQDKSTADNYSSAWSLTKITLPSGGIINVNYESDDYQYVQNKPAMRMFKTIGTQDQYGGFHIGGLATLEGNAKLVFDALPNTTVNDYCNVGDLIYFKCLVEFNNDDADYVTGYAKVDYMNISNNQLVIGLKGVELDGTAAGAYNPITKAGLQFARKYLSRKAYSAFNTVFDPEPGFGLDLLLAFVSSLTSVLTAFDLPNQQVYNNGFCHGMYCDKSWIRMKCPYKIKYGGGSRVKKLTLSDEWSDMTTTGGTAELNHQYGQTYSYTLPDGRSSGVASYEPMIGNDENPWRKPVSFTEDHLMGPDDEFYLEEPFGECYFPSPSVGYSRITVRNIKPDDPFITNTPTPLNITRHGTGRTVYEFYTTRDFPTITSRTSIHPPECRKRPDVGSLSSLFKINYYDYLTVSQGYLVELNDMNGKQKSISVFEENIGNPEQPVSKVQYNYKCSPYLNSSLRLKSDATIIGEDGKPVQGEIGVTADFISDMRKNRTTTESGSIKYNSDGFFLFLLFDIPMIWPGYSNEETVFRSSVVTKVVQRMGLLDEIVKTDLGSVVSTKNVAYDAVNGNPILIQTTTDFNDPVYALSIPAHWYYDGMGPASKNIGVSFSGVKINNSVLNLNNARSYFAEGDELLIKESPSNVFKGWVTEVSDNYIKIIDYYGISVNALQNTTKKYDLKVVRSGRRNLQTTNIATITSLDNPLQTIQNNVYNKVLQAQAVEYGNAWRTYCECHIGSNYTSNPFIKGTRGSWRPLKTYSYLTSRDQVNTSDNTNVRQDGTFTSFSSFYKVQSGKWSKDDKGWTFASEVTQFSPLSFELENVDALGIYSSATYGYNQTLPTAVAHNASYQELAFDGYEDYGYGNRCMNGHFKADEEGLGITSDASHTGLYSIKVDDDQHKATYNKQLGISCPSNICNIILEQTGPAPSTNAYTITISNGTAPYNITWDVIAGSPGVYIVSQPSPGVIVDGSDWEIQLSVRDASGCLKILNFTSTQQ